MLQGFAAKNKHLSNGGVLAGYSSVFRAKGPPGSGGHYFFSNNALKGILYFTSPLTVNVDIFACIHFHGFMKMGNFARIKIHILCTVGSLG